MTASVPEGDPQHGSVHHPWAPPEPSLAVSSRTRPMAAPRRVRGGGFLADLREAVRPIDLAALAAVPAVLIAVYWLPQETKLAFVLAMDRPTLLTAFTAHYVHLSRGHLLANLVGYLLVVPVVYGLAVLGGRRRSFLVAFVTFLVAFPVALSALNLLFPRPRIGYGFSGVNMAFLGVLPTILLGYLAVHFDREFRLDHAPLLFFFVVGAISIWAGPPSPLTGLVTIGAALGSALYLRRLADDLAVTLEGLRTAAGRTGYVELAATGVYLFVFFPFAAFPPDPVGVGVVLDVYTHALGFCLGFMVSYATFRLVPLHAAAR